MRDIKILKNNKIQVDEAIELLGDLETYEDLLNDFLEEAASRLSNLEEYYKNGDMENYTILVHTIKSDSKYLGLVELADIALEHQLKGESNDLNYIKNNYSKLIDEFKKIVAIIEEYLK